ncbi:MAG: helix-turn-helix domain-containing protein, partial [Eubacterium sp.]
IFTTDLKSPPLKNQSIFVFQTSTDLALAHNLLKELFDLFDGWKEQLAHCLINELSLINLLDCSQLIFENPILIHNRDFEFIAYSSVLKKKTALAYLVGQKESCDAYTSFQLDREFQKTFEVHDVGFFPDTLTGIQSIYVNIFQEDAFIARIVIPEVIRPLTQTDRKLLAFFVGYIQIAIVRYTSSGHKNKLFTLDSLVYEILRKKVTDMKFIEDTFKIFHWKSHHSYFCTVISTDSYKQNRSTYKMISNQLKGMISQSSFVEYKEKLVIFTNLDLNKTSQSIIMAKINEFIRDNFLKVGYSRIYEGFRNSFRLLYKQAEIAFVYGNRFFPEIWIHSFDQIIAQYMLENILCDLPAAMVSMPEIVAIYNYDMQHDTQYLKTLKVYLENNLHQVSTAKALFIHRTTLLYRLEKISDLFHLRLDDPQKRQYSVLSIHLLEMNKRSNET